MSTKKATTTKAVEAIENTAKATENTTEAVANTTEYESVYSISELSAAGRDLFEATDLIVKTALMLGGKKEYTLSEAKDLVHEFTTKEVKK